MDVFWLEQSVADVPEQADWLSAGELACLSSMRFEKRRADWRLGRWTAKCALAVCLDLPSHHTYHGALAAIEIRPAPSGAPEVFLGGEPAGVTISLSHRAGVAICAIALCNAALGCDLEIAEPRSQEFVADYFTAEEQDLIAHSPAAERDRLLALLWSAKESALKALHEGLRLDTRSVTVKLAGSGQRSMNDGGMNDGGIVDRDQVGPSLFPPLHDSSQWQPLSVQGIDGQVFQGWWLQSKMTLRTVVAAPAPAQPIAIKLREVEERAARLSESQRAIFS